MALQFTLSPEHCARFYDALTCLSKFSENVSLEARHGQLILSALNSSKSAYASFTCEKDQFFLHYEYDTLTRKDERFSCRILNKALASIFRGRLGDSKTGEGAIERCEAVFDDGSEGEECRLLMKLIYRQGLTKTFRLTYEATAMMQAVFDKGRATNSWKASARMLREFADHFGPRTEQLDICSNEDEVTLTSYTEKITNGKETLKQPLQTAVTIDTTDFDQIDVEDNLHIVISVKDFRAIVQHAITLLVSVTTLYSVPSQPLQLSYSKEGMRCEFTLMTLGDYRGTTPAITRTGTRELQAQPGGQLSESRRSVRPEAPSAAQSQRRDGRLGSRTTVPNEPSRGGAEVNEESLFVPPDDEDQAWDPPNDQEEEEARLAWDPSGDDVRSTEVFVVALNADGCRTLPSGRLSRTVGWVSMKVIVGLMIGMLQVLCQLSGLRK
ncbi:MAG: hypothetical protein Q9159_004723 [Coniocarpon cinnabarinum]